MKKLRFHDYGWVIKGLTAIILLTAFILMLYSQYRNPDLAQTYLTPLTGITVLLFTTVRIFPVLKSRYEKDYLLIMYSEILISLVIGILFIALQDFAYNYFSKLIGVIFYIRGCVYFFTTSKRYELSDFLSYIVNILLVSFGFALLFAWPPFTSDKLLWAVIGLSLLLSIYFGYGTYSGYNNTHQNRQNQLKMDAILNEKEKEDENVIKDPKHIEEKRNPKIIDEPKQPEIKPTIDEEEDRDSDIVS